jgi:hypothetical protein
MPSDTDVLSFAASARAIDAAPLMIYGDAVALTRNGNPFFAGTALPPRLAGQPNEENHAYTVVSPCYDLARTFYQQANLPAVTKPIAVASAVPSGGLVAHVVQEFHGYLRLFPGISVYSCLSFSVASVICFGRCFAFQV